MADETHHRDVNHTFADMKDDDPNPFISMHKQDAAYAWRLNNRLELALRIMVRVFNIRFQI
jgi:hypothetical protein